MDFQNHVLDRLAYIWKKVIKIVSSLVYSSQETEPIYYEQELSGVIRFVKKMVSMVTSGVNYVIGPFSVFLTPGHSHDVQQRNTGNHDFGPNFSAISRGATPNGRPHHRADRC